MRQVSCQCLPVQGRFFPRLAVAVGKHEPASQSSQRTLMTLSRSRISLCLPPTSSSSVLSSSCSKLNGEWLSGAPFRKNERHFACGPPRHNQPHPDDRVPTVPPECRSKSLEVRGGGKWPTKMGIIGGRGREREPLPFAGH